MSDAQATHHSLDRIGFWTSTLCALHCGLLPMFVTFLPLAASRFVFSPAAEAAMIALSAAIAIASLVRGYARHGRKRALGVFGVGLLTIAAAHLAMGEELEILFAPAGALLIALSHAINYRLSRTVHACKHG